MFRMNTICPRNNIKLCEKPAKITRFIILTAASLLMPGCVRRIQVHTNTYLDSKVISNGFVKNKTFAVFGDSFVDGVRQNDVLATKELVGKIKVMLEASGFEVTENSMADYFLLFNYGCQSHTYTYNALRYIPGQTYTSNATFINQYGYYGQCNKTTTGSGSYTYVPEQRIVYYKFLSFYIYDGAGWEKVIQDQKVSSSHVWFGTASGIDEYADLRSFLDFLLVAMFRVFGSSGTIDIGIYENDGSVKLLRDAVKGNEINLLGLK